ncbi:MAG: ATP-binding cassette domain-containing protein [Lachnospiraceae bacterium]
MYVEVKNYSKVIKGIAVLKDINVRFEQGIVYGLQGKNGSGKTMLMRAICGLIRPTEGSVIIDGKVLGKDMSFPESIGVLIENPSFLANCTGYENLEILASIQKKIGKEEIEETLRAVGLEPSDKRKYRKYSLGMKQKLGIAAAVMEHPDIIILDEPINAIDEEGVGLVEDILENERKRGAVIIIACHDKEEMERLADEIICIEDGKIAEKK